MINRIKPKSEFSRNVLTLMSGTVVAQAIPYVIEKSQAGVVIKTQDIKQISGTILELKSLDKAELQKFGTNGYNYLINHFEIKTLVDKLEKIL